ncbi:MAG: hypothetical protein HC898_06340 [Phycisphaerales bacterium]|nr:hypothetical protein [Phycisphaerales bacterium]
MNRKPIIALWACLLYNGAVVVVFTGHYLWGQLGTFRPSDNPDPEARFDKVLNLLIAVHEQFAKPVSLESPWISTFTSGINLVFHR